MQNVIDLIPATLEDAELVHKLQIEAFMPLYEKYHDDETSPVRETLETVNSEGIRIISRHYHLEISYY